jgi:hypothetical protein
MVVLPRLARRLNSPAIAGALALVLIAVGVVGGLILDDIPRSYSIVIIVVGVINLIRAIPEKH